MIVVDCKDIKPIITQVGDPMVAKGQIHMSRMVDGQATGGFSVSMVTFPPGVRLSFHTHTSEQILYVTEGKGILATKEKEYVVTPGMVVVIPAGEVHWHGATEDSSFTHIAMYGGESKVVE